MEESNRRDFLIYMEVPYLCILHLSRMPSSYRPLRPSLRRTHSYENSSFSAISRDPKIDSDGGCKFQLVQQERALVKFLERPVIDYDGDCN